MFANNNNRKSESQRRKRVHKENNKAFEPSDLICENEFVFVISRSGSSSDLYNNLIGEHHCDTVNIRSTQQFFNPRIQHFKCGKSMREEENPPDEAEQRCATHQINAINPNPM